MLKGTAVNRFQSAGALCGGRKVTRCCRSRQTSVKIQAGTAEPGSVVLVAGATGGVGQLVTAKLLERGYKVRAVCRTLDKGKATLGSHDNLEVVEGDMREASQIGALVEGVDAICCCTGTTAFPTRRWNGNNGPKPTDYDAVKNLIDGTPSGLQRFVLTTSMGVDRANEFPFAILNTFGVLKYKGMAEAELKSSGLPWSIIRPCRLTDGPYTSYDVNTLLKATSGSRQSVELSPRDDLTGEASRIVVAELVVQSLRLPCMESRTVHMASTEGEGPGTDGDAWQQLIDGMA